MFSHTILPSRTNSSPILKLEDSRDTFNFYSGNRRHGSRPTRKVLIGGTTWSNENQMRLQTRDLKTNDELSYKQPQPIVAEPTAKVQSAINTLEERKFIQDRKRTKGIYTANQWFQKQRLLNGDKTVNPSTVAHDNRKQVRSALKNAQMLSNSFVI